MDLITEKFVYKITDIDSVYDGDSATVEAVRYHRISEQVMDFGFNDIVVIPESIVEKRFIVKVRMYGFDTPELRDKRPDWKAAGYLARDVAAKWLHDRLDNDELVMFTHQDKTGKFGRYLANFWGTDLKQSLRNFLLDEALAVPYHGQNKAEVAAAHADNIAKLKAAGRI